MVICLSQADQPKNHSPARSRNYVEPAGGRNESLRPQPIVNHLTRNLSNTLNNPIIWLPKMRIRNCVVQQILNFGVVQWNRLLHSRKMFRFFEPQARQEIPNG
jgi:hypothetical protein